jgi:catechol 2,3-dioxygenase-like lactoylglutathione lyase family enzyme
VAGQILSCDNDDIEENAMSALGTITLISVPVSDQQAAKAFYADQLGFTVVTDADQGNGDPNGRWIQLVPPGGGATITLVTWFDDLPPGACKLSLSTPDADRAHAELVGRGVKVDHEPRDEFWGRYFSLRDPDGNHWLVNQQREDQPRPGS